jgi:HEAT repeat protein
MTGLQWASVESLRIPCLQARGGSSGIRRLKPPAARGCKLSPAMLAFRRAAVASIATLALAIPVRPSAAPAQQDAGAGPVDPGVADTIQRLHVESGAFVPYREPVDAIDRLVRMGSRAVPDLIRALENPDWQIRTGSAKALGLIGLPAQAAGRPLLDYIRRSNSDVDKSSGVRALSEVCWRECAPMVPDLLALYRTATDRFQKGRIVRVFGNVGPDARAAGPALDEDFASSQAVPAEDYAYAAARLAKPSALTFRNLIRLMGPRELVSSRVEAAVAVAILGYAPSGVSAGQLLSTLLLAYRYGFNPDDEARITAAEVSLWDIGPEVAVPELARLLGTGTVNERVPAARALAVFGPEAAGGLDALTKCLADPPRQDANRYMPAADWPRQRELECYCVQSLGGLGHAAADRADLLVARLRSPDVFVRLFAAEALDQVRFPNSSVWAVTGDLLSTTAIDSYVEELGHPDSPFRTMARKALLAVGRAASPALARAVADGPSPPYRSTISSVPDQRARRAQEAKAILAELGAR